MTMKQIKSTGKMMRKTCQPKNNVADGKLNTAFEYDYNMSSLFNQLFFDPIKFKLNIFFRENR